MVPEDKRYTIAELVEGLTGVRLLDERVAAIEKKLGALEFKPSQPQRPIPDRRTPEVAKLLLSVKDAAFVLSVCTKTVRNYIKHGYLRHQTCGRKILIARKDLEALAKAGLPAVNWNKSPEGEGD